MKLISAEFITNKTRRKFPFEYSQKFNIELKKNAKQ